jgi:hypothetical protein
MKILQFIIIIGLFVSAFFLGRHSVNPQTIVVDSIVYDTITKTHVEHDTVWLDKIVYVEMPMVVRDVDTLRITDTVLVAIPMHNYRFQDEMYDIEATGYNVGLKRVTVYPRTEYRTTTINDRSRWGLGVQAGYGVSKDGLSPYIGIGVSYNILTW